MFAQLFVSVHATPNGMKEQSMLCVNARVHKKFSLLLQLIIAGTVPVQLSAWLTGCGEEDPILRHCVCAYSCPFL